MSDQMVSAALTLVAAGVAYYAVMRQIGENRKDVERQIAANRQDVEHQINASRKMVREQIAATAKGVADQITSMENNLAVQLSTMDRHLAIQNSANAANVMTQIGVERKYRIREERRDLVNEASQVATSLFLRISEDISGQGSGPMQRKADSELIRSLRLRMKNLGMEDAESALGDFWNRIEPFLHRQSSFVNLYDKRLTPLLQYTLDRIKSALDS